MEGRNGWENMEVKKQTHIHTEKEREEVGEGERGRNK